MTATVPPLLTPPLVRLLVASLGALGSFYLLIPVVPAFVAGAGGGGTGAGLCTGVLMLGTVLAELAAPALITRLGYRTVVAVALLLLGAPAVLLLASSWPPVVLGVCLLRGAGAGFVFVAGAALVAELAPDVRRAEVLGVYGAAVGIPSIVCLPSGVWLSTHVGFAPVFVTAAAVALLSLGAVRGLPARSARVEPSPVEVSPRAGDGGGSARPAVVFAAVALVAGVLLTFLPLSLAATPGLAAVALLVQACTTPLARWAAGRYGDRYGGSLLVPAVTAVVAGTVGLGYAQGPVAVIAGVTLFGAGFGVAQNVTLALMFARVSGSGYARASMLWNLAYDAGMGVGAVGFGLLVAATGYPAGFALTAAALLPVLVPAWRERRRFPARPASPGNGRREGPDG
ncbi:MFS transporter [Catellatospora citrea]|uniref:MFS transporter n=1 Tax=Catellatospora citrea TaxID=53366 RepID=A0A8J3KEQ4_9ACTN|nr:MFS transporter [Catellatospora citrea]